MSRGSKHRPKHLRLRGRVPQEENEPEGVRAAIADDDEPTADRLTRPHGPARNRRTPTRRELRSPGARSDGIPTPGSSRSRPLIPYPTSEYPRKASVCRPSRQPHRRPPTPQATPSFSHPSVRRSIRPATPACAACAVIRAANSRLYGSLLAGMRRDRAALDAWADDVGVGDGSTIEEMDWQPESMTIVVPTERRLSEMRRMVHAADTRSAAMPGYDGVAAMPGYDGVAAAAAAPGPGLGCYWGPRPAALGMGMPRSADLVGLVHTCKECGSGAFQGQGYAQSSAFRHNEPFKPPFPLVAPPPQNLDHTTSMRVVSASRYQSSGTLMAGTTPEVPATGRNVSILYPGTAALSTAARDALSLAQRGGAVVSDAFAVTREMAPVIEGSAEDEVT